MVFTKEPQIDWLYATTTLIQFPDEEGGNYGTGFFYNSGGETYLVTNKHVLSDHNYDHEPDSIRFYIRGATDFRKVHWQDLSIEEGVGEDWFIHPDYSTADVAVVSIPQQVSAVEDSDAVTGSRAFSSEWFITDQVIVSGGDSAIVVGYPDEFIDPRTRFPVIRDARIASPYSNWFNKEPKFILDSILHQGTSGSPVLTPPDQRHTTERGGELIGGKRNCLLGVHSGTYKTRPSECEEEEHKQYEERKLNLNEVWYIDLVEDIIESI
jgi:V8-like Glu-specific endopeptidase